MARMLLFVASVLLYSAGIQAEPFGPPESACYTIEPFHYSSLWTPNEPMDDPPYELVWERLEDGITYRVILRGMSARQDAYPFKGFMIQAKRVGSLEPVGIFIDYDQSQVKTMDCPPSVRNTLCHFNSYDPKTRIVGLWQANDGESLTDVYFKASIVQTFTEYFKDIDSTFLA